MFYSQEMRNLLAGHTAYATSSLMSIGSGGGNPLNQLIYFGYKMMLMGLRLNQKGDRVAMHSSVETQHLFLDEDVISFCASINPQIKLNGFKEKYLLR